MRKTWREVADIKDDHVNEVVLFDEGDHYIALCEDARILAETCGVILTGRDYSQVGRVELAGFPAKELSRRVTELVHEGWAVHVTGGEAQ